MAVSTQHRTQTQSDPLDEADSQTATASLATSATGSARDHSRLFPDRSRDKADVEAETLAKRRSERILHRGAKAAQRPDLVHPDENSPNVLFQSVRPPLLTRTVNGVHG